MAGDGGAKRRENMKEREKSFGVFFDWIDDLDHLEGADAWKVIKAIAEYHRRGANPLELVDGQLKVVVSIMFHQIKRREELSKIRRQAVNTRYNRQDEFVVQNSTKPHKELQQATTVTVTSNSNSNDITSPLQGESNKKRAPAHAHTRESTRAVGVFENVYLTDGELGRLREEYGVGADEMIDNLSRKLRAKGYQYEDHYAAILLWAAQDGVKLCADEEKRPDKSYDTEEFFSAALERSYQTIEHGGNNT